MASNVTGADSIKRRLAEWVDKTESLLETRMARVAGALEGWAKTEHAWQPDRPHTEGTITAFLSEVTPEIIEAKLTVDLDAALWLELFHGGRWSWLWPVMMNHSVDILQMLGASNPGFAEPVRNPEAESEAESARQSFDGLRESRQGDRAYRRTVRE